MAGFGKFVKRQLMPEDPLDWIVMILVVGILIGGIVLVSVMFSYGLI